MNCILYYDTARYDNRGHFKLKAWMSEHNLIFIQNGYNKYCLDMEVMMRPFCLIPVKSTWRSREKS